MMRVLLSRALGLFRRRSAETQLDDEVRTHLDLLTADYERRGMSPAEARRAARRAFGGVEQMKEQYRDRRGWRWMEEVRRDSRLAWRTLVRNPAYACTTIVTLALGIGANAAVFGVIDAAMFRALPVAEPDDLVAVDSDLPITYPAFQRLKSEQRALAGLLATTGPERFVVRWPGVAADTMVGTEVSAEYFSVIGAGMAAGRPFTTADERAGADGVAVISHDLWQRRFEGSIRAIGQSLLVNTLPVTVVGVAAPGFQGEVAGAKSDVWVLISQIRPAVDLENRGGSFFQVVGRLRPDTSAADAQRLLSSTLRHVLATEPDQPDTSAASPASIRLQPAGGGLTVLLRRFELSLWLGLAFVALVLAVACANLAGLSLTRAVLRQQELSVRAALGASRARLIVQLLIESVWLALAGGLAGLLIAYVSAGPLTALLAGGLVPLTLDVTPNLRVMAFAALVSIGTGVLFGLAPALRGSVMRTPRTGRGDGAIAPRARLAGALVAGQVGLSVVLLVAAGLLVTSLRNIVEIAPGFDRDNVLLVDVRSVVAQDGEAFDSRFARLRDRVMALPGVLGVSASWLQVFEPFADLSAPLAVEGYTPRAGEFVSARYNAVSPGYFSTIGLRLAAGREFTPADGARGPLAVVVNESFAKRYFGGQNPVGRTVRIADGPPADRRPRAIVGLVGDARYNDLRREIQPMFYTPLGQLPRRVQSIEVRTVGVANPIALGPSLRSTIANVAPDWVVEGVRTMAQQVDRPIAAERFIARVAASVGVLALALTAVGLYGLLSYLVARRTAEIGIRVALGASALAVIQPVLRKTAWIVAAGVLGGVFVAMLATRVLSSFLYGLSATDPATVALVAAIVVAVALGAAYVPARRATRVDPLVALRSE
jgi:predicted permease